ncbi:hypothetical protein AB6813_05930 [bacterium RCC_150]
MTRGQEPTETAKNLLVGSGTDSMTVLLAHGVIRTSEAAGRAFPAKGN